MLSRFTAVPTKGSFNNSTSECSLRQRLPPADGDDGRPGVVRPKEVGSTGRTTTLLSSAKLGASPYFCCCKSDHRLKPFARLSLREMYIELSFSLAAARTLHQAPVKHPCNHPPARLFKAHRHSAHSAARPLRPTQILTSTAETRIAGSQEKTGDDTGYFWGEAVPPPAPLTRREVQPDRLRVGWRGSEST
jgi:hypothetical protein